ncbi:MAG: hypothetical protein AAGC46_12400, partial [Solirubrobacteraceae bacterium]|nr:hypothetical protein [Patulibacter sp.]
PKRSVVFKTLPGGAQETAPRRLPRLSAPAMIVMAISLLVITIGGVVALQIRMTQVNERMGEDLGAISTIQQQNIQMRERLTRQTTSAVVDNVAANRKMIEPDVSDVVFRSAGNRAKMAMKAAAALKAAPIAPTDTAAGTTTTATDSGTADTGAAATDATSAGTAAATSATGASMGSGVTSTSDTPAAATTTQTSATGTVTP